MSTWGSQNGCRNQTGRLRESLVEHASRGIRYAERSLNSFECHAFLCLKAVVYERGAVGVMKDSRALFRSQHAVKSDVLTARLR